MNDQFDQNLRKYERCLYFVIFLLLYDSIICVQFIFYSGGQLVSCKASLAALRLYGFLWYCYDDVLSENEYDDDDDDDDSTHRNF